MLPSFYWNRIGGWGVGGFCIINVAAKSEHENLVDFMTLWVYDQNFYGKGRGGVWRGG